MGLATIIDMIVYVCVPAWGDRAAQLAWTLWWMDVLLATSTCVYLPFVIIYIHDTELSTMTAAWLLPIISTIVAAASGGIIAGVLPNPQHALWTMIVSYILWGMGVSLALVVLVIYFHRLTVYRLPPKEVIVSVFLPLGPLGQGGFAIQKLGQVARDLFPQTHSLIPGAGDTLYTMGFIVSLILWGYGLVWLFFALASISRSRFPFNMGWWCFTFPLGVFTLSTTTMAKELPSTFFRVLGSAFSVVVVLLWLMVSVGTIKGALTTEIFFAACAAEYEKEHNSRKATAELQKRAREGQGERKPRFVISVVNALLAW
jgi:tellurite resistance protein TehA-like permease